MKSTISEIYPGEVSDHDGTRGCMNQNYTYVSAQTGVPTIIHRTTLGKLDSTNFDMCDGIYSTYFQKGCGKLNEDYIAYIMLYNATSSQRLYSLNS